MEFATQWDLVQGTISKYNQSSKTIYTLIHARGNKLQGSRGLKLIVNDSYSCDYIYSDEGATQGDVAAMAKYAVGIRPLINTLAEHTKVGECIQAWYADDSSAVGILKKLKEWWDALCITGPKLGYFPKPSITILIVKSKELLPAARALFEHSGMKIICDGERHLIIIIIILIFVNSASTASET